MSPRAICPRCNAPGILVRNFRIHGASGKLPDEPTTRLCTKCGFLWRHNGGWVDRSNALSTKYARINEAFDVLSHELEVALGSAVMEKHESLGHARRLMHELACAEAQRQEAIAEAYETLNELHCAKSTNSSEAKAAPDSAAVTGAVLSDTLAQVLAKHANAGLIEALNAAIKRGVK